MINIPAIPEGLEIPEKTELWGREETMPSAEPVKGQSRNGTEASWSVSAWKSVPWREIELPFARRPAPGSGGSSRWRLPSGLALATALSCFSARRRRGAALRRGLGLGVFS